MGGSVAQFPVSEFEKIPFIDASALDGRVFTSLTFHHEGKWRMWLAVGPNLMEIQGFPSEASYFSKQPEDPADLYLHFIDFIAQHASFPGVIKPLFGLKDDIYNLCAVIAKLEYFKGAIAAVGHGISRMIVTEIEYLFSVCRSIFDLLHEVSCCMWEVTQFQDGVKRKKLPKQLTKVMRFNDEYSNAQEMKTRFLMPEPWALWYERHISFFSSLREFRDNIVHHGSAVSSVFVDEKGFSVSRHDKPFDKMDIWTPAEISPNDVVPLEPAVSYVVWKTLSACEDFSQMLQKCILFPKALAPEMHMYMRGNFTKQLQASLIGIGKKMADMHQESRAD